ELQPGGVIGPDNRRVTGDHRKSAIQDVGARTMVALQRHRPRGGESPQELLEGAARCPAKTIDGLVRIAYREDVLLVACQQLPELDLADVGILKFINENEARTLAFLLEQLRITAQQIDCMHDHVTEG